jgi:hypothetical protein
VQLPVNMLALPYGSHDKVGPGNGCVCGGVSVCRGGGRWPEIDVKAIMDLHSNAAVLLSLPRSSRSSVLITACLRCAHLLVYVQAVERAGTRFGYRTGEELMSTPLPYVMPEDGPTGSMRPEAISAYVPGETC